MTKLVSGEYYVSISKTENIVLFTILKSAFNDARSTMGQNLAFPQRDIGIDFSASLSTNVSHILSNGPTNTCADEQNIPYTKELLLVSNAEMNVFPQAFLP